MKALVTGATGMIGGAIVDALLAHGHSVRALVRAAAQVDPLILKGVDLVVGDLGDAESLRQAVQGVDAVFHAAAALGFRAGAAIMDDVNVGGTERLLAASRAAGVGRFVHISSVAVYGPHEPPIDETTPQQPNDAYGRTKPFRHVWIEDHSAVMEAIRRQDPDLARRAMRRHLANTRRCLLEAGQA